LGTKDNDLKYFFPMVDIYKNEKEARFAQPILGDKDIIGISKALINIEMPGSELMSEWCQIRQCTCFQ
jgi:hypothetical protein